MQDVFIGLTQAVRKRNYDATEARLSSYVGAIANNVCASYFKKQSRNRPIEGLSGSAELESEHQSNMDGPDRILERAEENNRLRAALERLPEECRELLWLICCRKLSYKKISEILGAKEAALRKRTSRCRVDLRDMLKRKGMLP